MSNSEVRIFGRNFPSFALFVLLCAVSVLVYLGTWQLNRRAEKKDIIHKLEHSIASDAVGISGGRQALYTKLHADGKFLAGKNMLLYGRRSAFPEKDGYYILSSFYDNKTGQIYLVSRGWIPSSKKDEALAELDKGSDVSIEAIILPGERKGSFTPENDSTNRIWFHIDPSLAARDMGTTIQDYYLMEINSKTIPSYAFALSTRNITKIRNDHLEYAITWYILALSLVIIFIMYYNPKQDGHNN